MNDVCFDEDDDDGPERNEKGQWLPGTSGNPLGRPPKQVSPPKSLVEEFAEALSRPVSITTAQGISKTVPFKSALIQKIVAEFTKLPAKEMIQVLEKLAKLGVFDAMRAREEEEYYAAEDASEKALRAVLRDIRKALDDDHED
ncbi:MAG: DUF5681 domain-containing protein [Pseudorhodoplanes sp.]